MTFQFYSDKLLFMKNTKAAFGWITDILYKHKIPFQIAGGFAAQLYGATRELADIDIDVPENRFLELIPEVKDYIVFGPSQFKDKNWDLFLMTLCYQGQNIDIGGAYEVRIFNQNKNKWQKLRADLIKTNTVEVYGIEVPVIKKDKLIKYKKMLARDVDKIDIKQIS